MNLPLTLAGMALPVLAVAQDLVVPIASAPTGYDSVPSPVLPDAGELLEGLKFGLTTSFVYDSNIYQGTGAPALAARPDSDPLDGIDDSRPASPGSPIEDDVILSLAPFVNYRTQGARWTVGASASLAHDTYFSNSDLGGLGYSTGLDFAYSGRPLTVTGTLGSSLTRGSNRYYGGADVETQNLNFGLGANYRWSAKTSLDTRFSYSSSEPQDGGFSGNQNTSWDAAALWRASPLMTLGPGIRWALNEGDTQPERETIGPILRLNYKLGRKVALDGTFGADFVEYGGGGGSDTTFTSSLGINYRANSLWGMNLSLFSGTFADGSVAGSYRETTSVRVGYNRRIHRVNTTLGVSYETSDFVYPNAAATTAGARDYFSFDASAGMPVFWRRAQASVFFNWRQESGDPAREWDGFRFGLSLSSSF